MSIPSSILWHTIARQIADATGDPCQIGSHRGVGGGSINQAYQLITTSGRSYFVKCNQASQVEMFEAEKAGLRELAQAQRIRIPAVICSGIVNDTAYLVLEYISLGSGNSQTADRLGQQLAELHRTSKPHYGWDRANTIGSTPQLNPWSEDWISFYRDHRLGYQLRLARRQGLGGSWIPMLERLMENLGSLFEDYTPKASLLHGDLWGGNWGADEAGDPVLFDPAVYYGDRETDLAMTELFGGFPQDFYRSYHESYPLDPGYEKRKHLYQLYHLLNHLNLFGGSYLSSVQRSLEIGLSHLK
ncbi:MAG: fructosamine kinase family protein [Cyanophyceae cyanobacterium]